MRRIILTDIMTAFSMPSQVIIQPSIIGVPLV